MHRFFDFSPPVQNTGCTRFGLGLRTNSHVVSNRPSSANTSARITNRDQEGCGHRSTGTVPRRRLQPQRLCRRQSFPALFDAPILDRAQRPSKQGPHLNTARQHQPEALNSQPYKSSNSHLDATLKTSNLKKMSRLQQQSKHS